jgi:signal transduction histidine kinase
LAPIQSIAGSLQTLIERGERTAEREDDLANGLRVIESRAQALGRFMHAYARLARLPQPALASVSIAEAVDRAAALETRMRIDVRPGPLLAVQADPDQLDQLLINLVRNAADAALETHAHAWVSWQASDGWLEVRVEDEGPGLAETANLFVPFFTTKPAGTGIGLALSRQIAEAHGGTLTLENHDGAPGCVARVRLPLAPRETSAQR